MELSFSTEIWNFGELVEELDQCEFEQEQRDEGIGLKVGLERYTLDKKNFSSKFEQE